MKRNRGKGRGKRYQPRPTPLIAPRQYTRHPHCDDGSDVVTWRCVCWKTHQFVEAAPKSSQKGRIARVFTCDECNAQTECQYYDQTQGWEGN